MTKIDIITQVAKVVSPVFLVGGAVRDSLLSVKPKDFDFTTPLTPDEVEARVRAAGRRPYLVGKRFGTIGFKVEIDGVFEMVEVTTFRIDGPGRKPSVVFEGVSLEEDLARRDLTIGAMAIDEAGVLHDPFDGKGDIEAGVIRAVGNAGQRLREDPLRILRVGRFASQLGFSIEKDTEKAARKVASRLMTISRERVRDELDKLLVGADPRAGLEFLARTGAMAFTLPEVAALIDFDQRSRYHDFDAFEHTVRVV
ncbi:MAG: CCA tRNA nucleotidyltransferase, partial [Thermoleophilia bacterium]|nr:CCA tRNA nucleotidyltransferase [Thermoleophilia bacterium]